MPVRSLSSSVLKWPDASAVYQAVHQWAGEVIQGRPDILRIGYMGSYARGDWGVGSDLDLIVVVGQDERPFWRRTVAWDLSSLPVPTDILVYTQQEWQALADQSGRFYRTVKEEAMWIYEHDNPDELTSRRPAVAGQFYPADPATLRDSVNTYLDAAPARQLGDVRAVIAPHAGYPYSGPIAGHSFKALAGKTEGRYTVYLMGPAHYGPVNGVAVGIFDRFETPLGSVPVAAEQAEALVERGDPYQAGNQAHLPEHCLEVELPFVRTVLPDCRIVPMLFGRVDPEPVGRDLVELVADDPWSLIVVSSDLSHYYRYEIAQHMDRAFLEAVVAGDADSAAQGEACGITPILTLMTVADSLNWQPTLLDYRNSGDTGGDKSGVVGYAAVAYTASDGRHTD
ncbi:MAG: AmmeMemoRadiSam system protein B [Anaerolineae bacterium]